VPPSDSQDSAAPDAEAAPVDRSSLRPVQRTAAYAVITDSDDRVLLVRASARSDLRGRWYLPGGGLRHGEHPRDAVLRELREETGLRATRATPREATADVVDLPHRGVSVHTLRLLYDVRFADLTSADAAGGRFKRDREAGLVLRSERDGTSDLAKFVGPEELPGLPLMPFVAELLGLAEPEPLRPAPPERPEPLAVEGDPEPRLVDPVLEALDGVEVVDRPKPAEVPVLVQRPAAYAVLIDETPARRKGKRMLLTRLAESRMPGRKGTWTLPGGGIDHGEHPLAALEREVYEETGLPYTVGPLLDIGSRHFIGRAPSGRLEDFHGLRLVYAGSVPVDLPPEVIEVGGSTDAAAWIPVGELGRINTVSAVRESYATWSERRARGNPA
jgi:ADP-ribose pyrophosphatase YjhB (NUDIX family)